MQIVKSSEIKEFPLFGEVNGRIVFSSDRMMFLFVELPPKGVVPEHSHPHEQMGLCLKGRAEFRSEQERAVVEEGMFYWVKPGEKHCVLSLCDKPCMFLDVFNPPREDYLEKAKKTIGQS